MQPYLRILLSKTGAAGTVGKVPTTALPAADGDDAKSLIVYHGLRCQDPIEVNFIRGTQNGNLTLEASIDGENFIRVAFQRYDTNAIVSGAAPLVLLSSTRLIIGLPGPAQNLRLHSVRAAFWLAASGDGTDDVVIRAWENQ